MYQEPSVDKLTFILLEDMKLRIIIEEFENVYFKKAKVGFDVTCNLIDFINEVIESLGKLLREFGFVGYKITWCKADFPIGNYLKLKFYLMNKTSFPTTKELNWCTQRYSN